MEPIRVTRKFEEVPVILEEEDGSATKLVLREMAGTARDAHLQSMANRVKVSPKGDVIGMKNFDGMQASLLARCLYDVDGELIPLKEIQGWPARTQETLFEVAQKLNGLDKKAEEDAKND